MKRIFVNFIASVRVCRNVKFFVTNRKKFLRIVEHALSLHTMSHSRESSVCSKNNIIFFVCPLPSFRFTNMKGGRRERHIPNFFFKEKFNSKLLCHINHFSV